MDNLLRNVVAVCSLEATITPSASLDFAKHCRHKGEYRKGSCVFWVRSEQTSLQITPKRLHIDPVPCRFHRLTADNQHDVNLLWAGVSRRFCVVRYKLWPRPFCSCKLGIGYLEKKCRLFNNKKKLNDPLEFDLRRSPSVSSRSPSFNPKPQSDCNAVHIWYPYIYHYFR